MIDLQDVLKKYPECLSSADKLKAYLTDLYPNEAALIFVVCYLYSSKTGKDIQSKKEITKLEMDNYIKQLKSAIATDEKVSKNAILVYMRAFNIIFDDPTGWYEEGVRLLNCGKIDDALNLLNKSATRGNSDAQVLLGDTYSEIECGFYDLELAKYWYRQAAEIGNPSGLNNYAVLLLNHEEELSADYAFLLLRKAAIKGEKNAQINLANCYYKGVGTKRDLHEALYWYQQAERLGDTKLKESIEKCKNELLLLEGE